jgi:hypothetical protein
MFWMAVSSQLTSKLLSSRFSKLMSGHQGVVSTLLAKPVSPASEGAVTDGGSLVVRKFARLFAR